MRILDGNDNHLVHQGPTLGMRMGMESIGPKNAHNDECEEVPSLCQGFAGGGGQIDGVGLRRRSPLPNPQFIPYHFTPSERLLLLWCLLLPPGLSAMRSPCVLSVRLAPFLYPLLGTLPRQAKEPWFVATTQVSVVNTGLGMELVVLSPMVLLVTFIWSFPSPSASVGRETRWVCLQESP